MSSQAVISSPGQLEGSGSVSAIFIDRFLGVVDGTLSRESLMRGFAPMQTAIGTNTFTKKRIGAAVVKGVNPGSTPQADKIQFSNKSVTVDTIILARNATFMLEEIQNDFNVLAEVGIEQGEEHSKTFDQAYFIQLLKGADAAAPNLTGWASGTSVTLDGAGDETDPDKVVDHLIELVAAMKTKDVKMSKMILFINPTLEGTLLKAKYLSRLDMAGTASVEEYRLDQIAGLRVQVTNDLPQTEQSQAAGTAHPLTDVNGSTDFDISATEAKVLALIGTEKSFLAAESISLTADVWKDKGNLTTNIDSYLAFNVTYDRPDNCGKLRSF